MFKECFALEKIHGSSSNIGWDGTNLNFFSGGESHEVFVKIFDTDALKAKLLENGLGPGRSCKIFGEVYAGKCQGMSGTYGKTMKFVAFDVQIDESWLDVEKAAGFVGGMGLEFVHYVKTTTDLPSLDALRDAPSVQAIRNGISMIVPAGAEVECPAGMNIEPYGNFGERILNPKKQEGVVLRPLIELKKNNGARIICKHKGDDFRETKSTRSVIDPAKMQVLADAEKIAEEYVTNMRLLHVLDKLPGHSMERMRDIISSMVEDVNREGQSEFVPSEAVNKAIGKKTAIMYKGYLKTQIGSQ